MNQHIKKVHQHPFGTNLALYMTCPVISFFFDPSLYIMGDGFNLGTAFSFANDKILCRCIRDAGQVDDYDFFTFDILYGVNDEVQESFFSDCLGFGFSLCLYQNLEFNRSFNTLGKVIICH